MTLFNALAVSSTGMTSNRLWIDLIANNIANANSTSKTGEAYKRKFPIFAELLKDVESNMSDDSDMAAVNNTSGEEVESVGAGVQTYEIRTDASPYKLVYNPSHPHADKDGFVKMPNVEVIKEMVDMIAANRAYDASVQVANAAKAMVNKALEIGK